VKLMPSLCMLLLTAGAAFADTTPRTKILNGRFIVAQSYCGMCADSATSCKIKCNGSGTCLQACDDAFRDCVDQNCRRRY
jgi:hypothetical protein